MKTPHEQTAMDRQIAATDAQIDRLVYDLYGLTEEEFVHYAECCESLNRAWRIPTSH